MAELVQVFGMNDKMMDDRDRFLIAQEDNGNFLRVYIPGMPQYVSSKKVIKWRGSTSSPSPKKVKIISKIIKRKLFKRGLLKDLPQRQIPGYSSNYEYDLRPMATWEITPRFRDLIYVRNDVFYLMKHTLWFPLLELMKNNISQYDYIQLELPSLPQIVTEDVLESWYKNNLVAKNFLNFLNKLSQRTSIQEEQDDSKTILKLTNHPFVNQPAICVQVFPESQADKKEPTTEQISTIRQQVLTRDAYLLKGLTDMQRKKLVYGLNAGLDSNYHVHWVKWPSLGGQFSKDNALIVSSNIREMYQYSIREPLENFLKENQTRFVEQGKPVFVELPIPRNIYRSKPIPKIKLKRQDRRRLNEALKKSVREQTYIDE